jgi:hypothetical protein
LAVEKYLQEILVNIKGVAVKHKGKVFFSLPQPFSWCAAKLLKNRLSVNYIRKLSNCINKK